MNGFCFALALACASEQTPLPVMAEKPPLHLQDILEAWETQSQKGTVLQIEFTRIIYDRVFQVEKRCKGRLILTEGRYRIDFSPITDCKTKTSNLEGYKFVLDNRKMTYLGDAKQLSIVNHETRNIYTFEKLPNWRKNYHSNKTNDSLFDGFWNNRFWGFWEIHVPSYIRVHADDLKNRFQISLRSQEDGGVILSMNPRYDVEKSEFRAIDVLWNCGEKQVNAVKVYGLNKNFESVYLVNSYQIDPPINLQDLMNPSFQKYRQKVYPLPQK